MMKTMKHAYGYSMRGFTIVELLIVIVVIAILAAISTVAFNGIQQRAENTKTVQAVGEYGKALQAYAATNGQYPILAYPCLATNGTRCANMTDATASCNGATASVGSAAFETAIKSVVSKMPQLSTQQMACENGKMYSGGFYYSTDFVDGKKANMAYFLKGNVACAAPGSVRLVNPPIYNSNTTECIVSLPDL
jgi:prepilin-type N-terminal cleavage/methylation domain-containing protein